MIRNIIETHLIPRQDYIYGFADLSGLLHKSLSGFRFGISIGKKLDDGIIGNLKDGPTLEYYHYYNLINLELAELTRKIYADLLHVKIKSKPIVPTISLRSKENEEYLKSLTYDISHKMVATRAGLGWIGKTDLLISRQFGPRLRLVTILLEKDPGCSAKPIEKSKCGNCSICVTKCPAKAANGLLWNINTHRDLFFNAFKCRDMCGKLAKQRLNIDERICGMCIYACPVGKTNTDFIN